MNPNNTDPPPRYAAQHPPSQGSLAITDARPRTSAQLEAKYCQNYKRPTFGQVSTVGREFPAPTPAELTERYWKKYLPIAQSDQAPSIQNEANWAMEVADPTLATVSSPLPGTQDIPQTGYGQTTIGNQPQLSVGERQRMDYLRKWGNMPLSDQRRAGAGDHQINSSRGVAPAARPSARPTHYRKPMWDLDLKSDQTGHEGTGFGQCGNCDVYTRCYGSTGVPKCGSTTDCERCSSMGMNCGSVWSEDPSQQKAIIGMQSRQ